MGVEAAQTRALLPDQPAGGAKTPTARRNPQRVPECRMTCTDEGELVRLGYAIAASTVRVTRGERDSRDDAGHRGAAASSSIPWVVAGVRTVMPMAVRAATTMKAAATSQARWKEACTEE